MPGHVLPIRGSLLALAVDKAEHPPAPLPPLILGRYLVVARPDGHIALSSGVGEDIVGALRPLGYAGDVF